MGRFIVHIFAFIGLLALLGVGLCVTLLWNARGEKPTVPDTAVLKLDLTRDYVDVASEDPLFRVGASSAPGFIDLLAGIERATGDKRVKGLIADVGGISMSYAKVQELRDAIAKFRAAGKFAYAYARAMPGNKELYAAAGFEQVSVEPMGGVGLIGLGTESLFLRGTLDKIGIEPEVERRSDYKTAYNDFLFTSYTPAEKEMLQSFMGSISSQLVEGIAKGRNISADDVRAAIDRGPFTTDEALKAKLIDKIAYPDEIRDAALEKASEGARSKARVVGAETYIDATQAETKDSGTAVALIPASGVIVDEDSGDDELTGRHMGGRELARGIDKAIEDSRIKAILLRVDSPGGSVLGSDMIRHALLKAKKANKPVVVSMSGVAGSGGYWIAMSADAIIAEPATLTGSIGVITLKPNVEKLVADLGANYDRITFGANAAINSIGKPYSAAEHERIAAQIDDVYNQFKSGVAEGRNMTVEAVEKIAKGRVWSGTQGKDLGLVDQLGGFDTAKSVLREKLKLSADAPLSLVVYPKPISFFDAIRRALGAGSDEDDSAVTLKTALIGTPPIVPPALAPLLTRFRPYLRTLAFAFTGEPVALVTLPVDLK